MTIADIFNVGAEFKARDGTVYTLRKLTLYEQGEFQRFLEQRAHDAVERGNEPEEKKDRRHDRIYADSALGKYEWDGPYALEAVWTPTGLAKVLEICCRAQGVTQERAEEIVAESAKEVAAKMLRSAVADPKQFRLVLQALGLPTEWAESTPNEPSSASSSTLPSTGASPSSAGSATTSSSSSTPSREAPEG